MRQSIKSVQIGLYLFFEALMAFVVVYFMLFFGGGLIAIGDLKSEGSLTIYVKSNGVHTDLCFPVETDYIDWKKMISINDFPQIKRFEYISIGWGDKGFFLDTPTWDDLTFKTAFSAAFLPSGTAMHVAYLEKVPVESNMVSPVLINGDAYLKLIDFVKESFQMKANKIDLIPNRGYWHNDNFYQANGNYHLFKTCNSWTNDALKIAGVRTGFYALSAEGIMRHLQ